MSPFFKGQNALDDVSFISSDSAETPGPRSLSFLVALFGVLLQDGSRRDFLCAFPVTARFPRALLDVFVLSLLFGTYSTHVLLGHCFSPPVMSRVFPRRPPAR